MNQQIENMDILFRRMKPEIVLDYLRNWDRLIGKKHDEEYHDSQRNRLRPDFDAGIEQHYYEQLMLNETKAFTADEINMRFRKMQNEFGSIYKNSEIGKFSLLVQFSDKVLDLVNYVPVCRIDKILEWRDAYLLLGQDLLTTSWLAWKDIKKGDTDIGKKRSFRWPAVVKTNDARLNSILENGIAENHCHLGGSTQNFQLSWISMMNHPEMIEDYWKNIDFRYNLTPVTIDARGEKTINYSMLSYYAVIIRIILCCRNRKNNLASHPYREFMSCARKLKGKVKNIAISLSDVMKIKCRTKFLQYDGSYKCLDYMIDRRYYHVNENSHTRLLSGERHFLYECFYKIFTNEYSRFEMELFYTYILIKSNVRGEIIQLNKLPGFRNFARYQNRKSIMYSHMPEYRAEALRLSIAAQMKENNVRSLETRIGPCNSAAEAEKYVWKNDQMIDFALYSDGIRLVDKRPFVPLQNKDRKDNYYYAVHFIKRTIWEDRYSDFVNRVNPRNEIVRKDIKRQAIELKKYLKSCKSPRIFAVDAANYEVGCRPETFATEFRFLSECPYEKEKMEKLGWKSRWGITYHAGEDFLDIADGIRAIDEAITFFNMDRNDRLGHALAIGTEPRKYYEEKGMNIVLCKLDLLDNITWLLYRMKAFGVIIPHDAYQKLEREARRLFIYIYGDSLQKLANGNGEISFEEYFRLYDDSWYLRGDHPELYRYGIYYPVRNSYMNLNYETFMKRNSPDGFYEELEGFRNNKKISRLLYLYHYDKKVRIRGEEMQEFQIEQWYIELMKSLQKRFQKYLADTGIGIECNPSSNVLIGAFHSYRNHPLLGVDSGNSIDDIEKNQELFLSINTDDLGVFDTSLENEYALLFGALREQRHEEGKYNDEMIYRYLERLRMNGFIMSFCSKTKNIY